ncbi:putative ATPase [Nostoc sp. PCC 7524]|uniref:AAA family ATPase n=1 Tax=Nostoc sp. (strain ATCC 29411 / PCC 7524) TaxID=28072 RepID=UPI00029F14C0|nr:AAA family ATPase [Nostoc sp. PCC 7524]AFY47308.1 putative ATPase [Nostoc sp. PCC 7524]
MLRSLSLKNFRCFQNFQLEPLERVNLIAGKNNVGKTSLLEAIFMFINPTNPESLFQVNRLRGIPRGVRFEHIEELRGFFFDQDIYKVIEIIGRGENDRQRILKIFLPESEENQIEDLPILTDENGRFKTDESLTTEVRSYDRLVWEYKDPNEIQPISISLRADGRLLSTRYRREKYPIGIYLTTSTRSPIEDAERFSHLERVGRQDEVLKTLSLLEPRLRRLSLLVIKREPIINGDIGMRELVPLPLMGEGIGRLLSIILAIANAQGGTVLIDEVENGLHHTVLTDVWRAIADAARRADVQIFATTHSRECILAAHEAFEKSEQYDFRYHRLERVKDGIQALTYDKEALETSDEFDWEIR